MCTRDLPDMYALGPVALGLREYISGKSLVPMLQLLHKLSHTRSRIFSILSCQTFPCFLTFCRTEILIPTHLKFLIN